MRGRPSKRYLNWNVRQWRRATSTSKAPHHNLRHGGRAPCPRILRHHVEATSSRRESSVPFHYDTRPMRPPTSPPDHRPRRTCGQQRHRNRRSRALTPLRTADGNDGGARGDVPALTAAAPVYFKLRELTPADKDWVTDHLSPASKSRLDSIAICNLYRVHLALITARSSSALAGRYGRSGTVLDIVERFASSTMKSAALPV